MDRFEDPTFDAPELPFVEPVAFADEEGNALYEGNIPYGPVADVYAFDMHETPAVMLDKLTFYEGLPAAVVNGVAIEPQSIRLGLSAWLEQELVRCGHEMVGDSLEQVYHKFRMLRVLRKVLKNAA